MTRVQVAPGVQVETEQILIGMESMNISDLTQFQEKFNELLLKKNNHGQNGDLENRVSRGNTLTDEERMRIDLANLELLEAIHHRQVYLDNKRVSGAISKVEDAELQMLNQQIEVAKEERLKHLRFLTKVRKVPFEKLSEHYREALTEETIHLIEADIAEKKRRNQKAIEALTKMQEEGDPDEQQETWEYLKVALDEDRLSYRKLFP